MVNIVSMSMVIIGIIVIAGGIAVVQAVNYLSRDSAFSYGNRGLIDIVVIVMYIVVCAFTLLLYIYAGYDLSIVYGVLALLVAVLLLLFILYCVKNKKTMNRVYVVLFLIYFAFVLYLTIFMRIGTVDGSVETEMFDDLQQAIVYKNPSMAQHMIFNVLFFVPFGYFIPAMNKKHLGRWCFAMLGGLMTSTIIEGIQMVFALGQADIDDIIANTLGAVIGYGMIQFVWRVQKNWR